jgi:hypothetical protein
MRCSRPLVPLAFVLIIATACAPGVAPPPSTATDAPPVPVDMVATPVGAVATTVGAVATTVGATTVGAVATVPAGQLSPGTPLPTQTVVVEAARSRATSHPAESSLQPVSLPSEVFLAGPPLAAVTFVCDPLPADATLPAATWQQAETLGQVCLYGFVGGEEVRYEIYDSEHGLVDAGVTVPDTRDGPQPAAHIMLSVETYPYGVWSVRASSAGAGLEDMFEVVPPPGSALVALRLAPGDRSLHAGRSPGALRAGDDVFVRAVNLPGDAQISIGVYFAAEEDSVGTRLRLHEQALMPTDEVGTLSAQLVLDPSYGPGFYCIIVAAAEEYEPEWGSGEGGATECFTVVP